MRRAPAAPSLALWLCCVVAALFGVRPAGAAPLKIDDLVVDNANVLTVAQRGQLKAQLLNVKGVYVAIAVVRLPPREELATYAERAFLAWTEASGSTGSSALLVLSVTDYRMHLSGSLRLLAAMTRLQDNGKAKGSPIDHITVVSALHKRSALAALQAAVGELGRQLAEIPPADLADPAAAPPAAPSLPPELLTPEAEPRVEPRVPPSPGESLSLLGFALAGIAFFTLQLRLGRHISGWIYMAVPIEFVLVVWGMFAGAAWSASSAEMESPILAVGGSMVTGTVCLSYFLHALQRRYLLRVWLLGLFFTVSVLAILSLIKMDARTGARILESWVGVAWAPAVLCLLWIPMPPSRRRRF